MSRLRGLSQARRDRGRICRSQGPGWRLLCGAAARGAPSAPGTRAGVAVLLQGSPGIAPTLQGPLSVGGAGTDREPSALKGASQPAQGRGQAS